MFVCSSVRPFIFPFVWSQFVWSSYSSSFGIRIFRMTSGQSQVSLRSVSGQSQVSLRSLSSLSVFTLSDRLSCYILIVNAVQPRMIKTHKVNNDLVLTSNLKDNCWNDERCGMWDNAQNLKTRQTQMQPYTAKLRFRSRSSEGKEGYSQDMSSAGLLTQRPDPKLDQIFWLFMIFKGPRHRHRLQGADQRLAICDLILEP